MYGELHELDPDRQLSMIQSELRRRDYAHAVLPAGNDRTAFGRHSDRGTSTAAFQAVPYQTIYAATKAFDLIFAEGVAEEVKKYGVRVCALCPGADGVGVPGGGQ